MCSKQHCEVAVLLATYNGSDYVGTQIGSLKENTTSFTLHWLDDHSTDNTIDEVRAAAQKNGLSLCEWHQSQHLGLPSSFFRLLECVEADIYLFCDQDDIWEAGKIDATVGSLLPDISLPALSFTDVLMFDESQPGVYRRELDPETIVRLLQELRTSAFMPGCASGQTQGFTRPLRDIFLRHSPVAHQYAFMHDWWMYDIAIATGIVRMLPDAPKPLYRSHGNSFCARLFRNPANWLKRRWQRDQLLRQIASRHAQGLIIASSTLPRGPKLERMLELARLVAPLERRQSVAASLRLARLGSLRMCSRIPMTLNCLCSDAKILEESRGIAV